MLGPDQPVILQLLEITPALALDGVAMEPGRLRLPLLAGIVGTDDADVAFGDATRPLVGAMPAQRHGAQRPAVGQQAPSSP